MQISAFGFLAVLASCFFQGASADETDDLAIAAIVNDYPISVRRVERHLKKTIGAKPVSSPFSIRTKIAALEHLINRHIVFQAIEKTGSTVGESLVTLELSKLTDRLNEIDQTLQEYLLQKNCTKEELLYEFRWRIAWKMYLAKHLTDQRLEDYYTKHRRQFDGTKMQVAHLLLRNDETANEDSTDKGAQIKDLIERGEMSWNEAVRKHSVAKSSSSSGGEIGWVSYNGPMAEEFCHAAMKLRKGEISDPVQSQFGVHLIKCLKIKPGQTGPCDAKEAVRTDAMRFLFESISEKNRPRTQIEYIVDWQHDTVLDER